MNNMMRKNNNRGGNNKHRSGGGGNGPRRYNNNSSGGGGNRSGANDSQNIQRQKHHATQQLGKYSDMARNAQINGDRVDVEYYLQHVDHYTRILTDIAGVEAERSCAAARIADHSRVGRMTRTHNSIIRMVGQQRSRFGQRAAASARVVASAAR